MGIRKKILLGFVAIGFILLLSGVVAIFEMTRLTDLISGLLTNNIQTISSTNTVEQILLKQNRNIFNSSQDDEPYVHHSEFEKDIVVLTERIGFITNEITIGEEKILVAKLNVEFETYKTLLNSISNVSEMEKEQRVNWSLSYGKSSMSMLETVSEITRLNQDALSGNAVKLEGNYYRMIMPAIIAIIAGVFMILFFNYFINTYFVSPIIQIKQNIKSFLSSRTPYAVKVKTNDEISELNEEVKDLVNLLKKREKECNSLQNENREA